MSSTALSPTELATPQPSTEASPQWTLKHMLNASDLTEADINLVMAEAETFAEILSRPVKKVPLLRSKVIINLFYENSTRTRTSFELAAKYLSADTINFGVSTSSVKKGETLVDTAQTLLAMGADAVVIRHSASGTPHQLAQFFGNQVSVLNAGDGTHEHPTQGLLDLFTMQRHLSGASVKGKKVAIVGDVLHSRVARSNVSVLTTMGADVHLVGPKTLLPDAFADRGCTLHHRLEPALRDADVVMCLRLQLERQQAGLIPSLAEYHTLFGITRERLESYARPDVVLMHPGPMNRGVEISSDIADDPKYSVIVEQVSNGVAVRMALLHLLLAPQAAHSGAISADA